MKYTYLIYSPDEEAWWSNRDGWMTFENATEFTETETVTLRLPLGGIWIKI